MADYGFATGYYSRAMPVYKDGLIYIASSAFELIILPGLPGVGCWMLALNFTDGSLVWRTQLSTDTFSIVTGSPNLEGNSIYVGLSSTESGAILTVPGYNCCHTSGRVLSVDTTTGHINWNTPSIPDDLRGVGLYSGAAVWMSGMPIFGDYLYFGTGQLYQVPSAVSACYVANPLNQSCADRRVLFDSIVKVNKHTGAIAASFRASAADVWNIACVLTFLPGCQPVPALDYDITDVIISAFHRRVFATSKSGFFWVFDLDLNYITTTSLIQGNSNGGGYEWEQAYQEAILLSNVGVYLAANNGGRATWSLPDGTLVSSGGGAWIKYDGHANLKWVTPTPNADGAYGSPAVTNDVVFSCTNALGLLVALNTRTGAILWSYQTIGSMSGAPVIVGDEVYWPLGPGTNLGPPTVNQHAFLVFKLSYGHH